MEIVVQPARKEVEGTIVFEGLRYPRSVHSFIEKRIARWARTRFPGQPTRYVVRFRRHGEGHLIHCRLELHCAGRVWHAVRHSSGPHQALTQCLDHLIDPVFAASLANVIVLNSILFERRHAST